MHKKSEPELTAMHKKSQPELTRVRKRRVTGVRNKSHVTLPVGTAVALLVAYSMVFFYAPIEEDQGFVQKIFYLHVPLAIVTLGGLTAAAIMAAMFLRSGDRKWDTRSYVAVHISLILGVGGLITGSIWAKASWGHWWVWQEPTLVSYLIVLLLFCCYQPLRFAIEDPDRQSRYAGVFAVTGGAFIPINFIAVRMAAAYTHPRVFQVTGAQLPLSMGVTFLAALAAIALLFVTMFRFELRAKAVRARLRQLERAGAAKLEAAGAVARVARIPPDPVTAIPLDSLPPTSIEDAAGVSGRALPPTSIEDATGAPRRAAPTTTRSV